MIDNKRLYLIGLVGFISILTVLLITKTTVISHMLDFTVFSFLILAFIANGLDKENRASFIMGGSILLIMIDLIAVLAYVDTTNELIIEIGKSLLIMVFSLYYVFFILNSQDILAQQDITYKDEDLQFNKNYYLYQFGFILFILFAIVWGGAGFGAYFDFASLLIFVPLLATIKMENKIKALLLQQNFLLGFILINFTIGICSMLIDQSAKNVGVMFALIIVSSFYGLYYYLAWVKPKISKVNVEYKQQEKLFFSSVFLMGLIPFFIIALLQ